MHVPTIVYVWIQLIARKNVLLLSLSLQYTIWKYISCSLTYK